MGPAQGGMAWRMMIGVANRYQRSRREPTSAGRTDQCLACFPVHGGRVQLNQLGNLEPRRGDEAGRGVSGSWETRRGLIEATS
jgi:hypothetical protein